MAQIKYMYQGKRPDKIYRDAGLSVPVRSVIQIFQHIIEKILQGIPYVVVYLDDILITGPTETEHLNTLQTVLERLEHYGIRLKQSKCHFMQPNVNYLGYSIHKDDLHTMPEKITDIRGPQTWKC